MTHAPTEGASRVQADGERPPKLLVVDDSPQNVRVLEAVLAPRGYTVVTAGSGPEALEKVAAERPDLVLLDIVMPGMDGYEVCRQLRAGPATALLPVVMITASGDQERVGAIEAGADDFVQKPFNQAELLVRIKSLLRVKHYHDTIQQQAAELTQWNRTLETRVREQVAELERLGRLRRFLSHRVADLLLSAEGDVLLEDHRRQIAVLCCQLEGFTDLAETSAPEELMAVLREYHAAVGTVVSGTEASIGPLSGDQVLLFFNDPLPVEDPAGEAVRVALALQQELELHLAAWRRRGYQLHLGVGIDVGYATLGSIGFEARTDYGPIGPVVHAATRLRDAAQNGRILVSQRVQAAVEEQVETTAFGDVALPGLGRPGPVFVVERLRHDASARVAAPQPAEVAGGPLTPREREVAALIARGYTNRQIAEALVVAEPTAVRHVANILNKLQLNSRARVAVWAVEQGLVPAVHPR